MTYLRLVHVSKKKKTIQDGLENNIILRFGFVLLSKLKRLHLLKVEIQ